MFFKSRNILNVTYKLSNQLSNENKQKQSKPALAKHFFLPTQIIAIFSTTIRFTSVKMTLSQFKKTIKSETSVKSKTFKITTSASIVLVELILIVLLCRVLARNQDEFDVPEKLPGTKIWRRRWKAGKTKCKQTREQTI